MANDFEQRMSKLTDCQLLDTIAKMDEYVPEAQAAARAEVEKRGGIETLTLAVNEENKPTPVQSIANQGGKKNLWAPFWAAVIVISMVSSIGGMFTTWRKAHKETRDNVPTMLAEIARQLNADTPKMIDENIRLESVSCSGISISHIFTVLSAEDRVIDKDRFQQVISSHIRQKLYEHPQIRHLWQLEPGISVQYSYYTKDGVPICNFSIGAPEKQE